MSSLNLIAQRFRGFLPIVVDVETGGFDAKKDALLEIAAISIVMQEDGSLSSQLLHHAHIEAFPNSHISEEALKFNKIDPGHPFRFAKPEPVVLKELFALIKKQLKDHQCQRAVLVGHNPTFDLNFLQAATARHHLDKHSPFHRFTTFDTACLSALALGQTVLAKACMAAGISFDSNEAHSAIYDAEKTAELFCWICNRWQQLQPS